MKTSMTAAAVLAIAGSAFAQKANYADTMSMNRTALATPVVGTSTPPAGAAFFGFETAEGFTAGTTINGQQGWGRFGGATLDAFSVDTTNPNTGSQALRGVNDPGVGVLTTVGAASPLVAPTDLTQPSIAGFSFANSNAGGADWTVEAGDFGGAGVIAFRMIFSYADADGSGLPDIDIVSSAGGARVTIGDWTPGVYADYEVVVTPSTSVEFFQNGSLLFTDGTLGPLGGSDFIDGFAAFHDNFQIAPGEAGDLDDVYFINVPTPGALALLGVAGLAGVRRRR